MGKGKFSSETYLSVTCPPEEYTLFWFPSHLTHLPLLAPPPLTSKWALPERVQGSSSPVYLVSFWVLLYISNSFIYHDEWLPNNESVAQTSLVSYSVLYTTACMAFPLGHLRDLVVGGLSSGPYQLHLSWNSHPFALHQEWSVWTTTEVMVCYIHRSSSKKMVASILGSLSLSGHLL